MNQEIPPTTGVLNRQLGLITCILLVIGNIIGVGIFTTPGKVAVRSADRGMGAGGLGHRRPDDNRRRSPMANSAPCFHRPAGNTFILKKRSGR